MWQQRYAGAAVPALPWGVRLAAKRCGGAVVHRLVQRACMAAACSTSWRAESNASLPPVVANQKGTGSGIEQHMLAHVHSALPASSRPVWSPPARPPACLPACRCSGCSPTWSPGSSGRRCSCCAAASTHELCPSLECLSRWGEKQAAAELRRLQLQQPWIPHIRLAAGALFCQS